MKIIIPARMGSKGFPFKNRKLLKYTLDSIPEEKLSQVWVTTDDPIISTAAKDYGVNLIRRPDELGGDTTSIRDTLVHALKTIGVKSDELIVMLYLTYPERNWEDIKEAMDFFLTNYQSGLTESMLCRKEIKTHPYLCLQEHGVGGIFGKQLVQHDLYRRQDYPSCFEISHYITIFKAGALAKLNRNLYCDTTVFYPISDVTDVDFEKNLVELYGE